MRALLRNIRRNPDIIAVVVLALALGIAKLPAPISAFAYSGERITLFNLPPNPGCTFLEALTQTLRHRYF
jgi:hypothetical protein